MKFHKFSNLTFFIITLLTSGCEKIEYFDKGYIIPHATQALAHAASGDYKFPGQTIEAVNFGFRSFDGIEVDIQTSKNYTLWLSHDNVVYNCEGKDLGKFISTEDNTITDIFNKDSTFYYVKLDSVFQIMSEKWPEKYISLDIKRPYQLIPFSSYNSIADEIKSLVEKYELSGHVLIESSSTYLLKRLNDPANGIQTYYFCLGDFDKGVAEAKLNDLTGISFKINSYDELNGSLIELLHSSGLKIQVFYANEPADIVDLNVIGVDFMQTDNLDFYTILESNN